jgi:hypothetical protein
MRPSILIRPLIQPVVTAGVNPAVSVRIPDRLFLGAGDGNPMIHVPRAEGRRSRLCRESCGSAVPLTAQLSAGSVVALLAVETLADGSQVPGVPGDLLDHVDQPPYGWWNYHDAYGEGACRLVAGVPLGQLREPALRPTRRPTSSKPPALRE